MSYIVTTSAAGSSRTQIWNPQLPLALGHPLRWVAERTQRGVRIRHLSPHTGEVTERSFCEIPFDKLRSGAEIALPQSKGLTIHIRPAATIQPVFGIRTGNHLSIFTCQGSWVLESALFSTHFLASIGKTQAFSLRERAGTYSFDIHVDGVTLRTGDEAERTFKQGEAAHVQADQMGSTVLRLGGQTWRFGFSSEISLPSTSSSKSVGAEDQENDWFKRALGYATVALGAFAITAWLWPKSEIETKELIPPQFAKIVMTKPEKNRAASAPSEAAASSAAPKSVQNAAVVQAFRAKALSNAVSGLLKGGMTSLLAQSDFVAGKSASARTMFDAKSKALQSTGPAKGLSSDTNIKVAGVGGADGKGNGYAKGEHAGVKGQGQAFVSMDVVGATVDEGLTKDEVGEVIHRHLSEVRYCYESAMVRTPDIEGKLMVNFTIGGNGVVKSTEVKSSTLPDPRLDDCILRRLTTWKFPNPRRGIDVSVAYPFIFKTLGR